MNCEDFKSAFRRRFRDIHSDQYHCMKLQTTTQGRNESPQEFADRCRGLRQKIMGKTDDPVARRIHRENAERMLLASFISGLAGRGKACSKVREICKSLQIALAVQAENRKCLMRVFILGLKTRSD